MNIISAQLLSLTCLFVSMGGVFFLPHCFVSRQPKSFSSSRYQLGLSLANCLSGGVFIATFFVGLMPEVRNLFHDVLNTNKIQTEFPVTEFVIFMGFLLALGIEQYVLEYREKHTSAYTSLPSKSLDECNKLESSSETDLSINKNCREDFVHDCEGDLISRTATMVLREDNLNCEDNNQTDSSHDHIRNHNGHSHSDIKMFMKGEAEIRLGMLMVSLGIHSLFEGLALGLQTDVPVLVNLVIGVAVHELLVAFAMGVNVSRLKLPGATAIKLALIFSASIPAGQLLGLLIGHYRSTTAVAVSAVLQGLAAGTFVHVTFFEVIPAEFHEPGFRVVKVLSLGLGFMLLLVCSLCIQSVVTKKE